MDASGPAPPLAAPPPGTPSPAVLRRAAPFASLHRAPMRRRCPRVDAPACLHERIGHAPVRMCTWRGARAGRRAVRGRMRTFVLCTSRRSLPSCCPLIVYQPEGWGLRRNRTSAFTSAVRPRIQPPTRTRPEIYNPHPHPHPNRHPLAIAVAAGLHRSAPRRLVARAEPCTARHTCKP